MPKRRRWRCLVMALALFLASGCSSSKGSNADMSDFKPIDHKDSDAEHRANVREGIELELGTTLRDAPSDALVGEWDCTTPHRPKEPAMRFTYFADGTFRSPSNSEDSPRRRWRIAEGVYTELTWDEPMPDMTSLRDHGAPRISTARAMASCIGSKSRRASGTV